MVPALASDAAARRSAENDFIAETDDWHELVLLCELRYCAYTTVFELVRKNPVGRVEETLYLFYESAFRNKCAIVNLSC